MIKFNAWHLFQEKFFMTITVIGSSMIAGLFVNDLDIVILFVCTPTQ